MKYEIDVQMTKRYLVLFPGFLWCFDCVSSPFEVIFPAARCVVRMQMRRMATSNSTHFVNGLKF